MKQSRQLFYRAKKIEDCTREELLAACHYLAERVDQQQRWAQEEREMEQLFRDTETRIKGI